MKGKIKNKLQEMMRFSVSENLVAIQEKIDDQVKLYSVVDELALRADIRQLKINKFVLGEDKIHSFITLNIYLEAAIYDMRVFNRGMPMPKLKD